MWQGWPIIRRWVLVILVAVLSACGGSSKHVPRGDVWTGFAWPPALIQYYVEGVLIHEIYLNGSPTGSVGLVIYLEEEGGGGGFGLYKVWDKSDEEGGGVVFLDDAKSAGFLFGSYPGVPGLGMLAIIQKTHRNIPLDFLYNDMLANWVGVTKEISGSTTISSPTTLSCGSSNCVYTRIPPGSAVVGGTVSGLGYDPATHIWTGYYSEPDLDRGGDAILAMTPDKSIVFMINCDTDHNSPISYTADCSYFIGIRS